MSQTTNGENESLPEPKSKVQQEVDAVDSYLKEYMGRTGLAGLSSTEVSPYLSMTEAKLKALSAEGCATGAYLLTQEALFVQGELNRYQAKLDFLKGKIKRTIAGKISEYGGRFATAENREILAIKDNSYAQELLGEANKYERIIVSLQYIPTQLRHLSDTLINYYNYKMRTGNETTRPSQESRSN
jgi:hypothetical protein